MREASLPFLNSRCTRYSLSFWKRCSNFHHLGYPSVAPSNTFQIFGEKLLFSSCAFRSTRLAQSRRLGILQRIIRYSLLPSLALCYLIRSSPREYYQCPPTGLRPFLKPLGCRPCILSASTCPRLPISPLASSSAPLP